MAKRKADGAEPKELSTAQAAKLAKVDARTVRRWIKSKLFRARLSRPVRGKAGGQAFRIDAESFAAWLEERKG